MARVSEAGHKDVFSFIDAGDNSRLGACLESHPGAASARNQQNVSAVLYALYRRNHNAVQMLRSRLLALDLWEAAALGEAATVRQLLASGAAQIDAHSPDGMTALQLASFFGRPEVVEILLAGGADPNLVSANAAGIRALHGATAGRHYEIIERLVGAGADLNAAQANGQTALDMAIKSGDESLVKLLTKR
jgi:ankyrin repeat protein